MKKLTVILDDQLYRATKVQAASQGRLLKDVVADALTEWLEAQEDARLVPLISEARAEARDKGTADAREFMRRLKSERARQKAV